MKLQYLGTGGGAGLPEMFCSCRICEHARKKQGKEMRNRPLAILNDELCIDLPCDARSSFLQHQVDARRIRYLLVTHSHYDHFLMENLLSRPEGKEPIQMYISRKSGENLETACEKFRRQPKKEGICPVCCPEIHFAKQFVPITLNGPEENRAESGTYEIVPLPANHDASVESLNYLISTQGKHVLWLHDTGLLKMETIAYLKENPVEFDMISMDCALARGKYSSSEHMDILQCSQTIEMLRQFGCVRPETRIYLSHIGHLVERTHEELCEEAKGLGFSVAYDGMTVEI